MPPHDEHDHDHEHGQPQAHDHGQTHEHGHDHDHAHDHSLGYQHQHTGVHKDESEHDHGSMASTAVDESVSDPADGERQESLILSGMDCADCASQIEKMLRHNQGISSASVSFAAGKMNVCFNPNLVSLDQIENQIGRLGYGVTAEQGPVSKTRFRIGGMDCAECAETVRKSVALLPGVFRSDISFASAVLEVEHDRTHAPVGRIIDAVSVAGYTASPEGREGVSAHSYWRSTKAILTGIAGVLLLTGAAISLTEAPRIISILFYLAAMVTAGMYVARSALVSVRTRSLDMNFLMTVAAIGAAAIGEWAEGATVVFLFSLGNAMQGFSLERTREAIHQLMSLAPVEATVKRGGKEIKLPVEEIAIGETVIVRPGEMVPVDGSVTWGASAVNEAAITGESMPADKSVGARVYSGSHNEDGVLEIESTERSENTALSRIIRLVEEAQSSKAPSQQFIDRFARIYTPVVVLSAIAVAVVPTLLGGAFDVWLYRALALLIIACPCALVISTPVSLVSAIGAATRHGVLIKDGAALENLGTLRIIAFDKTGTLTKGRPELRSIRSLNGFDDKRILEIAASVEQHSPHPLGRSIVQSATARGITLREAEDFSVIHGRGVRGTLDGQTYLVGKPHFFREEYPHLSVPDEMIAASEMHGETAVLVGSEDGLIGLVTFSDQPRLRAATTVEALRRLGIDKTIVITGDNERTARKIAADVGVDEVYYELLPEEKVQVIKNLQAQGFKVGVVGDGVNDAPALALADVGIAMGAIGSDITLETADVALLSDDLSKVPYAVELSRKTLRVIRQNVYASIAVKIVFLTLAPIGLVTLWLAVLADTGVALVVTANGMRLFRVKESKAVRAVGHRHAPGVSDAA